MSDSIGAQLRQRTACTTQSDLHLLHQRVRPAKLGLGQAELLADLRGVLDLCLLCSRQQSSSGAPLLCPLKCRALHCHARSPICRMKIAQVQILPPAEWSIAKYFFFSMAQGAADSHSVLADALLKKIAEAGDGFFQDLQHGDVQKVLQHSEAKVSALQRLILLRGRPLPQEL